MDLHAIAAQLPKDPQVQLRNVDIGLFDTWKDGDWISVRTMVRKYPPADHLILVSRNVQAVFGPGARIVTNRVLDEVAELTPVDLWYQVFNRDSKFGVGSDTYDDGFFGEEYRKATLRRIGSEEGALIEMTDDTGTTYILDVKKRPDDFFFFHPHEPLVVTFV